MSENLHPGFDGGGSGIGFDGGGSGKGFDGGGSGIGSGSGLLADIALYTNFFVRCIAMRTMLLPFIISFCFDFAVILN
ncbi:hypothetical protein [uncultured Mucilaginibacter sp.]|uniref:hypothetical protein n=1 Tax=uncultured Mucilaginibacter sp. TaxID=797541 RepID=UPI0025D95014|nr:hypothetical protein [uncultured Mucilaginibacter sp.]